MGDRAGAACPPLRTPRLPGGLPRLARPSPGRHTGRPLSPGDGVWGGMSAISEPDAKCHRCPGRRRFPGGARGRSQRLPTAATPHPQRCARPGGAGPRRRRPAGRGGGGGGGGRPFPTLQNLPGVSNRAGGRRVPRPKPPPRGPSRSRHLPASQRGEPPRCRLRELPPAATAPVPAPPAALRAGQRPGPGAAAGRSGSPHTPRRLRRHGASPG